MIHFQRVPRVSNFPLKSSKFYYSNTPEEGEAKEVGSIDDTTIPEPHEVSKPVAEKLESTETVIGESTQLEFQAETRKLLDIVAKSLYTDKEVRISSLVYRVSIFLLWFFRFLFENLFLMHLTH